MRIKCKYKGKVTLLKNNEIIIEEELTYNDKYEPKDYIEEYLKNHKIDNLENINIEFEFSPLVNEEWTFTDAKVGDYYIIPYFINNSKMNNIELNKDFYIVENLMNNIYINPYRASYIYNNYKKASFLVFYNYNERMNTYEEILILSMPSNKQLSEHDIDAKILQFCNLVSVQ